MTSSQYNIGQVIGIPMGTNSAPLLADLFLHTFEYDSMVKTIKQDITKAIQFSNTFRYIDDLFSINNLDFGNYIIEIYPSELQLTDTSQCRSKGRGRGGPCPPSFFAKK